ncbi:MAG: hypothetical protein M3Y50_03025 [Acidobacteriota bacterium]|nr:hypothetical protein [Acidobacteriota bacterium]
MSAEKSNPLPAGFRPWIVASIAALLVSLLLALAAIVAAFVFFSASATPLWVTLLGGCAVLGVALGFGGLFTLMAVAGWRSHRESRRVQIISPTHPGQPER